MNINEPEVYTTGKIAKLCSVSIRTVARWIESDHLQAYRLPGDSTEYRVTKEKLLSFLKQYRLPYEHIEGDTIYGILLIDSDKVMETLLDRTLSSLPIRNRLSCSSDIISGAIQAGMQKPHLLLLNLDTSDINNIQQMIEIIRKNDVLKRAKIIIYNTGHATKKDATKLTKLADLVLPERPDISDLSDIITSMLVSP